MINLLNKCSIILIMEKYSLVGIKNRVRYNQFTGKNLIYSSPHLKKFAKNNSFVDDVVLYYFPAIHQFSILRFGTTSFNISFCTCCSYFSFFCPFFSLSFSFSFSSRCLLNRSFTAWLTKQAAPTIKQLLRKAIMLRRQTMS